MCKMDYLYCLQHYRWCRAWKNGMTSYNMRIGREHGMGTSMTLIDESQFKKIQDWFLEEGVELNASHNLWWKYTDFHEQGEMINRNYNRVSAGYEFSMSKDAHDKLFKNNTIQ